MPKPEPESNYSQKLHSAEQIIQEQQNLIAIQKIRIQDQADAISAVKNSISFRLGWALTFPLRWGYNFIFDKTPLISAFKQALNTTNPPASPKISFAPFNLADWEGTWPEIPTVPAKTTVLVYMPFMATGGAEHLAFHVMHALPEVRWVVVTTVPLSPELGSTETLFRQVTPYIFAAGESLKEEQHFSFLTYLIDQFQPDVFYLSNGSPFIYACLPFLKKQYPQLKIADQVYDYQAGWINQYSPAVSSFIDICIGANPDICQAYIQKGCSIEKVHHIEHCIDTSAFDIEAYPAKQQEELKQQLGIPTGKKIVAFLGRLHPQKRPVDFLELARRFESDPDVFFVMFGEGPLNELIDQQLQKLQPGNFLKRPFYKPAADILAIIDVLVLPSAYEGMPIVILEAQAMGKAVVATDVGNNKEFLAYTQGGYVVDNPGDLNGLQKAVQTALQHPVDVAAVRRRVIDRVDSKRIARQYFEAFFDPKQKSHA